MKIYSPEVSAQIIKVMMDAEISNQGRATVYGELSADFVEGLTSAGHKISTGRDAFGKPCRYVFTPRAWAVAIEEVNAKNAAFRDAFNARQMTNGNRF